LTDALARQARERAAADRVEEGVALARAVEALEHEAKHLLGRRRLARKEDLCTATLLRNLGQFAPRHLGPAWKQAQEDRLLCRMADGNFSFRIALEADLALKQAVCRSATAVTRPLVVEPPADCSAPLRELLRAEAALCLVRNREGTKGEGDAFLRQLETALAGRSVRWPGRVDSAGTQTGPLDGDELRSTAADIVIVPRAHLRARRGIALGYELLRRAGEAPDSVGRPSG
jgi:hypothetical protein